MKKRNRFIAVLMASVLSASGMAGMAFAEEDESPEEVREVSIDTAEISEDTGEEYEYEDVFHYWNPDAPALNTLIDYVESVTDEESPDYIPPEERIATFDMDGTLCAELCPTYLEYYLLAWRILVDPTYQPDTEMLEFGRMLRDHALDKSFPEHMDIEHALHAAKAYAGMTINEFSDFVTNILVKDVDGFEGMTYAESFYLPMIEVIDYLQENDFKVFVCSGSDRFICRTYMEGMIDVPYENIIGMDVELDATNQEDPDGLEYVFTSSDDVVRTDRLIIKNLKMNKVRQIMQEIGRQPVLSFGNSGGDMSMHNFTLYNNKYKSAAFMLIADDDVRDYGDPEKAEELRAKWEESGLNVISMKNDFATIYGEDVKKTGTFRWLDELSENRIPADAPAPTEQPAEGSAAKPAEEPVLDDGIVEPEEAAAEAVPEAPEETTPEAPEETAPEEPADMIDLDAAPQETPAEQTAA